jgi:hypothetical protein
MTDFLLRSADMTELTSGTGKNAWYPDFNASNNPSSAFKFTSVGLRLETPTEVYNAPMSPFFLSVRCAAGPPLRLRRQGAHADRLGALAARPRRRRARDGPQRQQHQRLLGRQREARPSPSVRTPCSSPCPRRPLLSLAQLGSASFAQVNTDADLTVGASFAHPGIMDLTKVTDWPGPKDESEPADKAIPENGYVGIHEGTRIIRNIANVRTDHAFAANLALWDAYYFSGLNLQATSYSLPGEKNMFPSGPDLPTDTDVAADQPSALKKAAGNASTFDATSFRSVKEALEAGYNPLANKRVLFQPDTRRGRRRRHVPRGQRVPAPDLPRAQCAL